MIDLVVATGNRGKLREIDHLLQDLGFSVLPLSKFPDSPEVVEDGETFEENAIKKARIAALHTGKLALADDSGLVVSALNGLPGVRSARFAGENATDRENNAKLLQLMKGLPLEARSAYFRSVVALCTPEGDCLTFDGEVSGLIIDNPRGVDGFGYDPLFLVHGQGLTMAELPLETKNNLSHRGIAFRKLRIYLTSENGKKHCNITPPVL